MQILGAIRVEATETEPVDIWATVCKMVRPVLLDRCPVCNVGALWPYG